MPTTIPKALKPLNEQEAVEKVVQYQGTYADYSILLERDNAVQEVRVFYLKDLRETWEWVESNKNGKPFVLLKKR